MGGEMPLMRIRILAPVPAAAGAPAGLGASAGFAAAAGAGAVVGAAAGFGTSVGRLGVPQAATRAAPPNAATPANRRRRLIRRTLPMVLLPLLPDWSRSRRRRRGPMSHTSEAPPA